MFTLHLFLYFSFIVFHTPPPPLIYTLSLHDALPIFPGQRLDGIVIDAGEHILQAAGSPFDHDVPVAGFGQPLSRAMRDFEDRKSTRLNSSHVAISYAVFCLKKKK